MINNLKNFGTVDPELKIILGPCIESLSISGDWTNTQYAGSPVDYTGLTFTVTYNDGTTASVTPTSISPSVWGSTVGTQTCTFTYEENRFSVSASKSANVIPSQKVGGTIFYIDNTASGTYRFFNAQGQEVSAPTVGTDCTGWSYEAIGANKDKFYVYESTTELAISKYWGYFNITTSATGNSIGAGKTNTSTILAITDTSEYASGSIWEYIRNMRTNKVNGCDDWFVGCDAEYDQLRSSGTTGASWFSSKFIWSSREYNSSKAYLWFYDIPDWRTRGKRYATDFYAVVPLRAF